MFTSHRSPPEAQWLKYQHPSVQDLAWLLFSPPLFSQELSGFCSFEFPCANPQIERWLNTLDHSISETPENFDKILRENYQRLGLYCESLFEFALTEGKQAGVIPHQLLARNVQIQENNRTLGECDVLARDEDGRFLHIELAVKFYLLGSENFLPWSSWIGPNSVDRLDIKLGRLLEHQLKILQHPAATAYLAQLRQQENIKQALNSQYFLKGYLFFPFTDKEQTARYPEQANSSLLSGYWMRYQEFFSVLNKYQTKLRFCHKMDWLTGPTSGEELRDPLDIRQYIEESHQRAQSYSSKTPALLAYGNIEPFFTRSPIMLVPDYWPATNMPSRKI